MQLPSLSSLSMDSMDSTIADARPADAPCRAGEGFDVINPPNASLIDACVHCGFCLSTCPSYRVLGTEMDSPRGRIYLMDGINEGQIPSPPLLFSILILASAVSPVSRLAPPVCDMIS